MRISNNERGVSMLKVMIWLVILGAVFYVGSPIYRSSWITSA